MAIVRVENLDGTFSEIDDSTFATPQPVEEAGAIRSLGDTLLKFGRGGANAVKAATDAFGANNAVSRGAGNVAEFLDSGISDEGKQNDRIAAQRLKLSQDQGIGAQLKAVGKNLLDNPIDTLAEGAGSILPTAAAMLLSKGKINPATIGTGLGVVQGAGAVKGSIYDATKQNALANGMNEQEADALATEAQAYSGENADQIGIGAGLGYLAGKTGAETSSLLTGQAKDNLGLLRNTLKGAATEGLTEGAQGGQEALAANLALQRQGEDVPLMRGVAGQAASEAVAGGLTGGAFGAADALTEQPQEQPKTPREQLRDTLLAQNPTGALTQAAAKAVETGAADGALVETDLNNRIGSVSTKLSDGVLGEARKTFGNDYVNELLYNYNLAQNPEISADIRGKALANVETMTAQPDFQMIGAPVVDENKKPAREIRLLPKQGGENVSNTGQDVTNVVENPNGQPDNFGTGSAGNILSQPSNTGTSNDTAETPTQGGNGDIPVRTADTSGNNAVKSLNELAIGESTKVGDATFRKTENGFERVEDEQNDNVLSNEPKTPNDNLNDGQQGIEPRSGNRNAETSGITTTSPIQKQEPRAVDVPKQSEVSPESQTATGNNGNIRAESDTGALGNVTDNTLEKPQEIITKTPLDAQANEAATSPLNERAEPTQAQKDAGNYKVGRAKVSGLDISIENPQGSARKGVDPDGKEWESTMTGHYGYIRGVKAKAPDKDRVDVYVKPSTPEDFEGNVFIVNQKDPKTGKFDEPKVMLGYESADEAKTAYDSNYTKDWQGFDSMAEVPMTKFKEMLNDEKAFQKPIKATKTAAELFGSKKQEELNATPTAMANDASQPTTIDRERSTTDLPSEPAQGIEKTNSLSRDSSWVIRNKETGETIMETFQKSVADKVNTDKYEAVPVGQHLAEMNDPESKVRQYAERPNQGSEPLENTEQLPQKETGLNDSWRNEFERAKAENDFKALDKLYSTVRIGLNGVVKDETAIKQLQELKTEMEGYAKELSDAKANKQLPNDEVVGNADNVRSNPISFNDDINDGSTIRDEQGNQYRVHYKRGASIIAHPIIDGKAQVNADSTVRFWVDKNKTPSGDNDRTDNVYLDTGSQLSATPQPATVDNAQSTPVAQQPLSQKPKNTTSKKSNTLLTKLRDLGGVGIENKSDITGERGRGFAAGGYNQIFRKDSKASLKGHIENGDLDDYLPPAMRLSSSTMQDEAYDSTDAYDYLADKIRNGERVIPYEEQERVNQERFDAQVDDELTSHIAEATDFNFSIDDDENISFGELVGGKPMTDAEVDALFGGGSNETGQNAGVQWQVQQTIQGSENTSSFGNSQETTIQEIGTGTSGIGQNTPNEIARAPQTNERQEARPLVEAIVKRRAAANQIGKGKVFDNYLAKAKQFLSGSDINPTEFKLASGVFKDEPTISNAFTQLEAMARAPRAEATAEKKSVVQAYKERIGQAQTAQELQSLAKEIQRDGTLKNAQATYLDNAVMGAIDALDSKPSISKMETVAENATGENIESLRKELRNIERNILLKAPSKMAVGGGDIESALKSPKVPKELKEKRAELKAKIRALVSVPQQQASENSNVATNDTPKERVDENVNERQEPAITREQEPDYIAKELDIDAERIKNGYSHRLLGGTSGIVKIERESYINAVNSLYNDLLPIAKNDAQKEALKNLTAEFKQEYIKRRYRVMDIGSTVVSSLVAGRSNFNSKQASSRSNALDRAESEFSGWLKSQPAKFKAKISSLKTDADIAEEKAKADEKAAKNKTATMNIVRSIDQFKTGDTVKFGSYNIARVSFDRDGYPSSVTVDATDLTDNKFDLAKTLFGGNKEKLRAIVDELRAEQAAKLNQEATAVEKVAQTPLSLYDNAMDEYNKGIANVDDYKAAFDYVLNNEKAITEYLEANFTKQQLFDRGGARLESRYKSEKKDRVARALYSDMVTDFILPSETGMTAISYGWGGDKYADIKRQVGEITQESLDKAMARLQEKIAERTEKLKERMAGIANPQTFEDFNNYLREKIDNGMSYQDARMTLTLEQRITLDNLAAEKSRTERKSNKEAQKTQVQATVTTTSGDIIETKHTKTGEPLFVVKTAERVEREIYNQWNATAKRMGGWYSSFRGNGAVAGFQFKTRENAEAFLKYLGGDVDQAKETIQAKRNAYADDRSQTAVERLTEMADRLEADADEDLNRDRKANTARRADMAARAIANANANKAMAITMRNIAKAIQSGEAKYLDEVRQKTQVELLNTFVSNAQYRQLMAKYKSYAEYEKHKYDAPDNETADFAEFPTYTLFRSDWARLGRAMVETDGLKMIGNKILSVANDVTDAYIKFAKDNPSKVGVYVGTNLMPATFKTKAAAEQSIVRSGFNGKAIVIQSKRGEYQIIDSPQVSKEKGVWDGDNDKRITFSAGFINDVVEKIGKANRRQNKLEMPWQLELAYNNRKKLERMGIETPAEMRVALREFISLKEGIEPPSKIKELERSMIGRKNDGLDFFPTPNGTADAMIDAAEIEEGMNVLEPSAGMGHIADRLREAGFEPDVVEFNGDRRELLELKGHRVVGSDFLELKERGFGYGDTFKAPDGKIGVMRGLGGLGSNRVRLVSDGDERTAGYYNRDELEPVKKNGFNSGYDRIIMNPPFSDRRDIAHVMHAYSLLKPKGRIVAIMGEGAFFGSDKKATEFRAWLESVGGTSEKLEEGTFNDPTLPVNTSVNARMVVIDKAENTASFSARPIFYSQLTRSVEEAKQAKAPAAMWKGIIKNLKGVKPDEIEWTGVNEWLDLQTGVVTKEQLLDYLNNNGVQVTETMLGDVDDGEVASWWNDEGGANEETPYDELSQSERQEAIERYRDEVADYAEDGTTTKYSQYTVKGGENYKELLLTLPENKAEIELAKKQFTSKMKGKYGEYQYLSKMTSKEQDEFNAIGSKKLYKSSHFDQPNILAHVRFDERETFATGYVLKNRKSGNEGVIFWDKQEAEQALEKLPESLKGNVFVAEKQTKQKTLFVQEIQSDWGQEGKKKGFNLNPKDKARHQELRNKWLNNTLTEAEGLEFDKLSESGAGRIGDVPTAPFVTKTDAWVSLAIKRMIRYAAENGFDKVAFINGQQAADLYDLSKQIDAIHYQKRDNGTYDLNLEKNGAFNAFSKNELSEKELVDFVGKEVADKILNGDGEKDVLRKGVTTLSGIDLKVGGEGMRTFYDSIVPKVANDVLKKLGGGKVAMENLNDGTLVEDGDGNSSIVEMPQFTFTITPEMRQTALAGLPMFRATNQASKSIILVDDVKAALKNDTYGHNIDIYPTLMDAPYYVQIQSMREKVQLEGFFDSSTNRVALILENLDSVERAVQVARHELLGHYGIENMLNDTDPKLLPKLLNQVTLIRRTGLNPVINEYSERVLDSQPSLVVKEGDSKQVEAEKNERIAKEVIAMMAEDNAHHGIVRQVLDAIRKFLKKIGFLKSDVTDAEITSLLRDAREYLKAGGKDANVRDMRLPALAAFSAKVNETLPDTITVDGIERPTLNSNGKPIHPTREGVERFWKWFGNSKVVDEQGRPLVVYHGTTRGLFAEFNIHKNSRSNGFVFTTEKNVALTYSGQDNYADPSQKNATKSGIYEAYLSIKNPKTINWNGDEYSENGGTDLAINNAKAEGYDGVLMLNVADAGIFKTMMVNRGSIQSNTDISNIFAAFEPTQIKSAIGNNGDFNPANPSILFSARSPQKVVSDIVKNAANRDDVIGKAMTVLTGDSAKQFSWAKNIHTQLDKARKDPNGFGKMFNVTQRFETDMRLSAARPAELMPSIIAPSADTATEAINQVLKGDKSQTDKKAVASFLFEGTLAGESVLDGKVFTDDELTAKGATPQQIKMYREARATINASLDETTAALAYNMVRKYLPNIKNEIRDNPSQARGFILDTLNEIYEDLQNFNEDNQDANDMKPLIQSIEDLFDHTDALKNAGYMPLSRFGQYSVTAYDEDGSVAEFYRVETEAEAKLKEKELNRDYANVVRGVMPTNPNSIFAGADPDTVSLFLDTIRDSDVFDVNDELFQEWYRNGVSDRSALKRMIQRKKTAGFDTDLEKVLASFITSNSRFVAQNYNRADMLDVLNYLRTDPNYKRKGDVFDEAKALYDYVNNPADPFTFGRSIMFSWFMGGSIASAAVNMTQPFTMTMPWLSQFTGVRNASMQLSKAMKLAGAITWDGKLPEGELGKALLKAREIGLVDPQEVHHLYKAGSGGIINKLAASKDLRTRLTGAATLWGWLFGKGEQFNRNLTFIAAWNVAKEKNMPNAFEFARKAVEETQGIYSKTNRPNWARGTGSLGSVGAMAFTFKQYSIAYIEMLARMARSGKEGKKAALVALGVLMLLSGGMGLPFSDDGYDVLDTALQLGGGEGNTRRHIRELALDALGEELGMFALYGASAFMPFDVQGRMGMGNLIPSTALLMPSNQENRARSALEVLGAGGSLMSDIAETVQGLDNGKDAKDVMVQLLPVAFKNVFKGADMVSDGFYSDTRGRKVVETDEADSLWKAIGFQPSSVASEQKRIQGNQQTISRVKQKESAIAEKLARARFDGDQEKANDALEELHEWNEAHPDLPIVINPRQIFMRLRAMHMTRAERQARSTPRELRETLLQ